MQTTKPTYVNFMPVYEPFLLEKGEGFGLATGNDTLLYCGAYYLSQFKPQEIRVLSKNEKNWDAGNVHIDEIVAKYNKEAATVSAELYLRDNDVPSNIGVTFDVVSLLVITPDKALVRFHHDVLTRDGIL